MQARKHPPSGRSDGFTPRTLYLNDGGVILCHPTEDGFRLVHCGSGQCVELHGSFADRMQCFLSGQTDNIGLTALNPHHPWLNDLVQTGTSPSASRILLGNSLAMLFIELTDRCNEQCIHCYAESTPECSERLEINEIKSVLEDARDLGNPAVQFTGGDPLIHPDIVEAVAAVRDLGYKTLEIYTNGLSLNDAMLSQLLPYRPNFAFSVYSHDAAVHDHITQVAGSHARTLAAIRRVQDAGLAVRVGIVLMPENKGQERAIIHFLQDTLSLEPGQIGLDVVRSTGRGQFMQGYQPDLAGLHGFGHRPDMPADSISPSNTDTPAPSSRHRGKLCVSASGNVYPCIFSRQTLLGSIRRQTLTEIMRSLNRCKLPPPSAERWERCRQGLSCSDCQAIAYVLGSIWGEEKMHHAAA